MISHREQVSRVRDRVLISGGRTGVAIGVTVSGLFAINSRNSEPRAPATTRRLHPIVGNRARLDGSLVLFCRRRQHERTSALVRSVGECVACVPAAPLVLGTASAWRVAKLIATFSAARRVLSDRPAVRATRCDASRCSPLASLATTHARLPFVPTTSTGTTTAAVNAPTILAKAGAAEAEEVESYSWTGGAQFNYPERACCAMRQVATRAGVHAARGHSLCRADDHHLQQSFARLAPPREPPHPPPATPAANSHASRGAAGGRARGRAGASQHVRRVLSRKGRRVVSPRAAASAEWQRAHVQPAERVQRPAEPLGVRHDGRHRGRQQRARFHLPFGPDAVRVLRQREALTRQLRLRGRH